MRRGCWECTYKHLGDASVFLDELPYYPRFAVRVVGSLSHAQQEAQQVCPALADAIRNHRLKWYEDPRYRIPIEALGEYVNVCRQLPKGSPLPALPEECMQEETD